MVLVIEKDVARLRQRIYRGCAREDFMELWELNEDVLRTVLGSYAYLQLPPGVYWSTRGTDCIAPHCTQRSLAWLGQIAGW